MEPEVNVQVLEFLVEEIDKFRFDTIPLHQLVNALDGGLNSMVETKQDWRRQFETYWLKLEIANAYALDQQRLLWYSDCDEHLVDTLSNMRRLVSEKIEE